MQPLSAFSLEMLDATCTLGACLLLCEVSQESMRGIRDILEFLQKGHKLCMNWRLDLMQTNVLLFGCFPKVFSPIRFVNAPIHYNRLNTSRLARFGKTWKHVNPGKTQCWFVDRFSLKNFSAAIDQCTIKSPKFVSTENFWSCLMQVQSWFDLRSSETFRGRIEDLWTPFVRWTVSFSFPSRWLILTQLVT